MAVRILIANEAHSSVSGIFFITKPDNAAKNKFRSCCQWRNEILNTYFLISLAKGAMMLRAVGKCVMMPVVD
jgi:hypothetical protein